MVHSEVYLGWLFYDYDDWFVEMIDLYRREKMSQANIELSKKSSTSFRLLLFYLILKVKRRT